MKYALVIFSPGLNSSGVQLFHEVGAEESYSAQDSDKIWHKAWFPVFIELSRIITRCKLDVRTRWATFGSVSHRYSRIEWTSIIYPHIEIPPQL